MAIVDDLAQWTQTPGALTCTYLSDAHRSVAASLAARMKAIGLDTRIDAVGNVIGRYRSLDAKAKTVIVGSHYDTVTNAGKYDGRLGIAIALVATEHLVSAGVPLPFHLDIAAFSEEEGVRFGGAYIGSSAIAGRFDSQFLELRDAEGVSVAAALRNAGLNASAIPGLAYKKEELGAYLEVHIEQGPVLLQSDLPVGVVTAIAGNSRFSVAITGETGHAGTVPMSYRHDAAAAAAEIVLLVEKRCAATGLAGTVGKLSIPGGAVNVVPGQCELSIDIRSGTDSVRQSVVNDVRRAIADIAQGRGVTVEIKPLMDSKAVPCSPSLQEAWAGAVERAGIPAFRLPSGAGHDAVMFDGLTDIGMLFVRCGNGGISHSPLETVTTEDVDIATRVLIDMLQTLRLSGRSA